KDAVEAAGVDLRPEPAAELRPQEGEHGAAEPAEPEDEGTDDAAVEELAPGDAEGLFVHRRQHRRLRLGRRGRQRSSGPLDVGPGQALDLPALGDATRADQNLSCSLLA